MSYCDFISNWNNNINRLEQEELESIKNGSYYTGYGTIEEGISACKDYYNSLRENSEFYYKVSNNEIGKDSSQFI